MEKEIKLPHEELTSEILASCFEVMRELGPGFLEDVYKNPLFMVMRQKGLQVEAEKQFEVVFRQRTIGRYIADLVVNLSVIVELKCCEHLAKEHQAQLFNYLKVARLPVGLLVNFKRRQLEWKRLQSNEDLCDIEEKAEKLVPF